MCSGLSTLICSIDGITAETHEAIRIGLDFDIVVKNVLEFIKLRDEGGFDTKVIIRFVIQEKNKHEFKKFKSFWLERINESFADEVSFINVHNWGDKGSGIGSLIKEDLSGEKIICDELFKRMVINADGSLAFCCVDDNQFFDLGNVLDYDPIETYNNNLKFVSYRKNMSNGLISNLDFCSSCTVPIDRYLRKNNIGVYSNG